jgi:nitrogenase molybdenum-iron protein alpha/beta subunit
MDNTIDQKETEILRKLELDVKAFAEQLKETRDAIVSGGYSEFPVLIAHYEDIGIAQKVMDKELFSSNFHYSASTLEELIERKIVLKERKAGLENAIKTKKDSVCILLLHPEVMKFIFTPLAANAQ